MLDHHSHVWDLTEHCSRTFLAEAAAGTGRRKVRLSALPREHWEEYQDFPGRVIVFGLRSIKLGIDVPDRFVADYVASHPEKLVGFMSVDPTQPGLEQQIREGIRMGLQGIKTSPIYAGYLPGEPGARRMFELAREHDLPVMTHQSSTFSPRAALRYGPAAHLDAVMEEIPDLRIIIAHLGYPWERETMHFIRRYPHAYVDLSAVHYRPWDFYTLLLMYQEWNLLDRVLLGSDFPFTTIGATLDSLEKVNRFVEGTPLPRIDAAETEAIRSRDILRIFSQAERPDPPSGPGTGGV